MSVLCLFGFHKVRFVTWEMVGYRRELKCERCGKWVRNPR